MSKLTKKEKPQLINQGSYGCIFKPGLKCNGKLENRQYITKIQKKETSQNEIKISEKLRKITDYELFFSPIVSSCELQLSKVDKNEISNCKPIKNSTENLVSSKVKYVGDKDLSDIIIKNPTKTKPLYGHLIETLTILEKNGIVHYDIKANNIIYNDKLKIPIMIDFGISFHKPINKKNVFYNYSNDYNPWCIDIVICSFIEIYLTTENKQREIKKEQIELLIYNYQNENPIFNYLSKTDKEEWEKNHKTYFYQFIDKTWQNLQDDLCKYYNSWDNYSLAVVFFEMLNNKSVQIPITKKIILQSPDKRLIPSETSI
jgi:serine/threonine protein kinase